MSDDTTISTYERIAEGFTRRVDGTPGDAWGRPSPCEGWTARDVVGHVVGTHRRVLGDDRPLADEEDPARAWREATEALRAKLREPGALEEVVQSPFGPMPRGQMVQRLVVLDTLVHTWDLARATGQDDSLDPEAVSRGYSGLKPMDAMLRMPGVFGPKVDAPADADEQTQFLAFLGRKA